MKLRELKKRLEKNPEFKKFSRKVDKLEKRIKKILGTDLDNEMKLQYIIDEVINHL